MVMSDDEETQFPSPAERTGLTGHAEAEAHLRSLLDDGALSAGWMIAGPANIGKATLAYRLVRAFLDTASLADTDSLATHDSRTAHLVAQKAHPDLFVAERAWDEKKEKFAGEITVDTIRQLISFMTRTSETGRKVAIIDSADELNRNAANALLKVLEEPPACTLLLLLTSAPGRLLPTIRSRCRVLHLKPLDETMVADFLVAEGAADEANARAIAAAAAGRPGFALTLAAGEGGDAVTAAEAFFRSAISGRGLPAFAERMTQKSAEPMWDSFKAIVLTRLAGAATALASGMPLHAELQPLASRSPATLVDAWSDMGALISRGEALNTNRTQIILGLGAIVNKAVKGG